MAYYIKGANGKLFEPGRKKRTYVDADGTQYTVWVKWVGGQCIYRPHKRVNGSYRVVPDTEWHQTEQAAQAVLDMQLTDQLKVEVAKQVLSAYVPELPSDRFDAIIADIEKKAREPDYNEPPQDGSPVPPEPQDDEGPEADDKEE